MFWDVQKPDRAIAIGLRDERYVKLVIEVKNPEQEIARIREAIASAPTLAAPAPQNVPDVSTERGGFEPPMD